MELVRARASAVPQTSKNQRGFTGCGKTSVFRGSELQLRHKVQAFNRALAPEEQILAFFRSLFSRAKKAPWTKGF